MPEFSFKDLLPWGGGGAEGTTEEATTFTPITNTTLLTSVYHGADKVSVTVLIVILVIIAIVGAAVFTYVRLRNRRRAETARRTQIQMTSTSSAGVYVDLTSSEPVSRTTNGKPIYKKNKSETEHLRKDLD